MSVTIERTGSVGTVVLDRREVRNAVDGPTAARLFEAFTELDEDATIAACVLWGSGGNFCSGADLHALGTERGNRISESGSGPMGPTRMEMSKPVVAAVEGYAVAGGLELALWCDVRIASETSVFGVFSRRWGVPLIDGGTVRLPGIVGYGRAMDLILTGRAVSAPEAADIGLVTSVVGAGEARMSAEAYAETLGAHPQMCLRSDRQSLMFSREGSVSEAMEREFALGIATVNTDEPIEGAAQFSAGLGRHGEGVARRGESRPPQDHQA